MKVIFENRYKLTSENINIPLIVNGTPMGIVIEVNEITFTVLLWDRFIHQETQQEVSFSGKSKPKTVEAIHLGSTYNPSFTDLV